MKRLLDVIKIMRSFRRHKNNFAIPFNTFNSKINIMKIFAHSILVKLFNSLVSKHDIS